MRKNSYDTEEEGVVADFSSIHFDIGRLHGSLDFQSEEYVVRMAHIEKDVNKKVNYTAWKQI